MDEHAQLGVVGPSVPGIGNVSALHDFSEEIAQVVPRYLVVTVQVVGQNVSADSQVTVVEGVHARPSL